VVEYRRSALVTGAAQGIGKAIAERLRADGLAVTIADLPSSAPLLVELAAALGGPDTVLSVAVDVSDPAQVDNAVQAHVDQFGGLDVIVANAGIAITAPLVETTVQQWAPVVENLAFVVCQCVHTELGVVYVAPARRRL